jgi:hypothetical protein
LNFFVSFLFPLKFFSVRTLFFNIRENNIKKYLFTCCIGDGKAASDEGAGGAPTSAAVVHEGTVPVAAFELLLFIHVRPVHSAAANFPVMENHADF